MTARTATSAVRRAIGGASFLSLAALCVRMGAAPVIRAACGLGDGARVVTILPRAAAGIPLIATFCALAALFAIPPADPRMRPSRRTADERRRHRAAGILMGVAITTMALAAVAPIITGLALGRIAARHGYRRCQPARPTGPYVVTWVASGVACPVGKADATRN